MKASLAAVAAVVSTALAGPVVEKRASTVSNANTPPVSVKGNAFFTSKGRFYIRGVDYQPGGSSANEDPIADANGCARDVVEFKKLGINTIRVYSVDNSKSHDACMNSLANAGIYLALDVNTPFFSLNRLNNASIAMSYNDVYLQSVFATVDAFSKYDNTLLFYSGNEVINSDNTTFAAPYVKAVTRDIKNYIAARKYRSIPVGYSAADVEENRYQMAAYMNCGKVRSDFFAFNDYSWCDPSSFTTSGWDKKVAQYGNYSQPIFLSEFGCNTNTRDFGEVAALYSSQMTSVYSGGLVYEYSQEAAGYGLVNIDGNSVSELHDFTALQSAYSKTPAPTGDGGYKASGNPLACPTQGEHWTVNDPTGNYLPVMPAGAQKYFTASNGAGPGPGNSGDKGSQTAGTPSTGFASSDGTTTSSGSSTSSKAAAASVRVPEMTVAPFIAGIVVLASSVFGGASLFF